MPERTSNVAIYWDFENIQASLVEKKSGPGGYGRTKFQAQELLIDVDSVMEYAATFGVVSINRAYCNWQWYGKYRETLLRGGLELIQLFPPGASAKNGGDIKLALDCTEDLLRFPHIDIVVIVGGDSDYLPLAQKVKAMGKTLVGIGTEANTNRHWARSCHEFKFYETLILDDEQSPEAAPAAASTSGAHASEARPDRIVATDPEELLRRAIRRLSGASGDAWVLKGSIRPMLKRLDPTFEEERHGARSFSGFIRKFEHLLEIRAGRNDQEIRLRAPGEILPEKPRDERGERRERKDERRGQRERSGSESSLDASAKGSEAGETTPAEPVPAAPEPEQITASSSEAMTAAPEAESKELPDAVASPTEVVAPAKRPTRSRKAHVASKAPAVKAKAEAPAEPTAERKPRSRSRKSKE
jgi:uncharacterized protein (TIGR00288 family)